MKNRLLIVDDEEAILYAYKRLFGSARMGMAVDTAKSMAEALKFLEKNKYSIVLTDLRLGFEDDLGGFRLIRAIKEFDKSTKVILVTAYGSFQVERESYRMGADYYLEKPVPTEALCHIFKELES
ncbi:MAG: response regulator [bacterium]|nr:response regulator [bacterium]